MSGAIQREHKERTDLDKTYFYPRSKEQSVGWFHLPGMYFSLLGLRGLWFMNGYGTSTNIVLDQSGNDIHLSPQGESPPYLSLDDLIPHMVLDSGNGQYFNASDRAALDILGTESYIDPAYNGLTILNWTNFNISLSAEGIIAKWAASNQSYRLYKEGTGKIRFEVSSNGTNSFSVVGTDIVDTGVWVFCAGRYDPSTEIAVFTADTQELIKVTNVTSIPASLYNGNASLEVGAMNGGGTTLDGLISVSALCAAALPDYLIKQVFLHGKSMFRQ